MVRILVLDWSHVPKEEEPKAHGRLLRYIAARGGFLSSDNQVFVTEDLDKQKEYSILERLFKFNKIHAYERVNVCGFDGVGRVF